MHYQYVGKSLPLRDALEKVTGQTRYIGDMKWPGMLYAKLLLSPVAHGKVINIDLTKAEKVPGVVAIFTYENTPQTVYNRFLWQVGQEGPKNETLLTNHVRCHGDRIAVVVAENISAAETAVHQIRVDLEELPLVTDPEEALEKNLPRMHSVGNPIEAVRFQEGNVEEAFSGELSVFKDRVKTQIFHHAAMEPHGYVASVDEGGGLSIWSPCQSVYAVRKVVAEVLGLPFNQVRVIKVPMGGSFGAKQDVILEPLVGFLARELRRPVQLILNRRETMIASCVGAETVGYIESVVDQDHRLQAQKIKMILNAGAYTSNSIALVKAMGKNTMRLYRLKALDFCGYPVHTNTPVCGPARGYGSPQLHILREIHLDLVANRLGIDPLDFRLKNLVHPGDEDGLLGLSLGNARIMDCLKQGAERFRWYERRNSGREKGMIRTGIGLACASYINGYYGSFHDFSTMTLKMHEDGTATLNATLHDLGCGTLTSIAQIVAETLSIDIDRVQVLEADTERSPYDLGTRASRVTFVSGACAKLVAEKVKAQLAQEAADVFGVPEDQLIFFKGEIMVAGIPGKRITYSELVQEMQYHKNKEAIGTETWVSRANPGSYGVHFVEVAVDTWTGLVQVEDYLAVHDVGKAINPGLVQGQIQGAAQMGIGLALMEELKVSDRGIVTNCSFSKYHTINAPDMPQVKVLLVEEGEPWGPYGAKSIGEVAVIPSAPAVVNAVNHALGTRLTELPLTAEKILEAVKRGQSPDESFWTVSLNKRS